MTTTTTLLLDDKKVFIIIGIVLGICLFIYLLPSKKKEGLILQKGVATSVIGYEPKYFNSEIYDLPNARMNPYMLFGGSSPVIDYSNSNIQLGYEKLLPKIDLVPKMGNVNVIVAQPTLLE